MSPISQWLHHQKFVIALFISLFRISLLDNIVRTSRDLDPHDLQFTEFCLDQIFTKYGTNGKIGINYSTTNFDKYSKNIVNVKDLDENRIDFWEFSHLLSRIGLVTPEWNDSAHQHNLEPNLTLAEMSNNHSTIFSSKGKRSVDDQNLCLSPVSIFQHFNISPIHGITKHDFAHLCPVLIFQLDQDECRKSGFNQDKNFANTGQSHAIHSINDMMQPLKASEKQFIIHTWLYALLTVSVISVFGFALVCLIPLIRCKNFNNLLQFLVSLAIGSLSGDALLHLIPHALGSEHDTDGVAVHGPKDAVVWKGLLALSTIFTFFAFEKLAHIYSHISRSNPSNPTGPSASLAVSQENSSNDTVHLERYQPLTPNSTEEPSTHVPLLQSTADPIKQELPHDRPDKTSRPTHISVHSNQSRSPFESLNPFKSPRDKNIENGGKIPNGRVKISPSGESLKSEGKSKPGLSIQALTVIAGDGIHNFFDGLAIGAAFASSITAGMSTALAVLCHELPHEIGDFAYLLTLGIPIRHAFWVNCLSTLFCIVGCVAGLSLGAFHAVSSWILASVGGMFLYIALVNMLPGLKDFDGGHSSHSHGHHGQTQKDAQIISNLQQQHFQVAILDENSEISHGPNAGYSVDQNRGAWDVVIPFCLQIGGIALGVVIMLVIALYEEDIKRIIS